MNSSTLINLEFIKKTNCQPVFCLNSTVMSKLYFLPDLSKKYLELNLTSEIKHQAEKQPITPAFKISKASYEAPSNKITSMLL